MQRISGRQIWPRQQTRAQFALPASGSVTKAVTTLVEERRLVKADWAPTGYAFDSPYFRGWVIRNTLADIGMSLDETTTPGRTATSQTSG